MTFPPHYTSLASALVSLFGSAVAIQHTDCVSGGDINKAYALTLNTGDRIFMKANAKENAFFFTAEAAALSAIAATGAIATPRVLCTGTDDGQDVGYSFLLMEYIQSAGKRDGYWETFACELAALHNADTAAFTGSGTFGFLTDNVIGARPQKNTPYTQWTAFFRDCRLAPQFAAADQYFTADDRAKIQRLLASVDRYLVEPASPSLLHGDLWAGNVLCGADGKAMLIDPASYVGHAEADIAMTELFGGFPPAFYAAYKHSRPLEAGYEERRDLYNLYQLLNHLNLFGESYLEPVRAIVDEYAS